MQDTEARATESLDLGPLDSEDELYHLDYVPLPWWKSWRFYQFRKAMQGSIYGISIGASWGVLVWSILLVVATNMTPSAAQRERNCDFLALRLAPAIALSLLLAGATKPKA